MAPQIFKKQEMIKISALAKRWQCSRQHIYNLIDSGRIPALRFGSIRCMFVPMPAVEELEREARVEPGK